MSDQDPIQQNSFMIEKIKERPISRRKLFRRTMTTALMAVMFGLIACVAFLLLEPVLSHLLYPEKKTKEIVFSQDVQEMAPEDMLSDRISTENALREIAEEIHADPRQLQEIFSKVIFDKENYVQVYAAMGDYVDELNHSMVMITGVSSKADWLNHVSESENESFGLIIAATDKELLMLADYTPLRKTQNMFMTFCFLDSATNALPEYQIPVTLKEKDGNTNLAVVSANLADIPDKLLEKGGITIASLGYSGAESLVGTPVVALGSPMGQNGSVGYGVINSVNDQSQKIDGNYKLFQTNIYGSLNGGGVLFNLEGKVVGIITTDRINNDMKNLIHAYGITELKKRIEKMSNGNKAAYMGICAVDVTDQIHREYDVPYGAYIRDVEMNSPAMEAGILQGDVLTAFDDNKIYSYDDYISVLMQKKPEDTVKLTLMRSAQGEYKEMKISLTLKTQ